ncbi:RNA-splicing factor [Bachmanniomyces sp. S44760]|nr:RNA-splicing factor [Bachmanniomyces sp. S44760]
MEVGETPAQPTGASQPLFKKRGSMKSTIRKRPTTPPLNESASSEYGSSDDGEGQRIKRRRKIIGVTAKSGTNGKSTVKDLEAPKHTADRSTTIASTNDATRQSNWFDESKGDDPSAKNLLGSTRVRPDSVSIVDGDGTYKGASNYQNFIQKNPDAPTKQVGPIKAPTNIRTITVTDFAPDVCKDYKQTGFCGFGDSCKYLHAREDYKQGWQLDKDWETVTKGKKMGGKAVASASRRTEFDGEAGSDEDDAMLEGIPFACIICKKPYTNPIITKCGHYFCESCALQRYRKSPACAACGAGTGGVFNGAKNLKKLLDRKRDRARKRREKAIEKGEEVSDDENDDDGNSEGI